MTQILHCTIPAKTITYPIQIECGLLERTHWLKELETFSSRFAVLADHNVTPLYGQRLKSALTDQGFDSILLTFPSGEGAKNRKTKDSLEDNLFEAGFGRDTCLIAIGGGVATDLGGYLAATYCRGIPLILIPTSLLAMVDACIGGKNGVNTRHGKNLVGTFYQPNKILIDPSVLKSLKIKELKNGIVEMIKHGLIADHAYAEDLKENAQKLLTLEPAFLESAIVKSIRIKQKIVEEDELENGKRRLLNFGHTIGHALEKLTDYAIPHGEAVAAGVIMESHLSVQLGYMEEKTFEFIQEIFAAYAIPFHLPMGLTEQDLWKGMAFDKKSKKKTPRFVLLKNVGQPMTFENEYCTAINPIYLETALQWMNHALRSH